MYIYLYTSTLGDSAKRNDGVWSLGDATEESQECDSEPGIYISFCYGLIFMFLMYRCR